MMAFKVSIIKVIILVGLFLLRGLSHRMSLALGRGLGRLLFKRMPERAQVAKDNLKLIYGDQLDETARNQLARKNFEHLGSGLLEILYVLATPGRLEKILSVAGDDYLQQAVSQKKGAIIFSGHLGNFFLLAAGLGRRYQVKFLYRRPSQPLVAEVYDWLLQRLGVQTIADNPRHLCAYHAYAQLKKQGVLGVLIDQVETGGLYVDFMGQPAGSTKGAGNMALKTGAPLVPVFCHRLPNQHLQLTIEPEFTVTGAGTEEQRLEQIVAGTNAVMGQWVRRFPEQWFWGHRRWRRWRK